MSAADPKSYQVGERTEMTVEITDELVAAFAEYSGDRNPLHVDSDYAKTTRFKRRVAHGMSYAALFSRLVGMDLPGPGALWMEQSFRFRRPAFIGDRLTLSLEVTAANERARTLNLACRAVNQLGEEIMSGAGEVMLLEGETPAAEQAVHAERPGIVTGGARAGGKAEAQARRTPAAEQTARTRRVAIVTGGARGIGAAIARRLSADGFAVALTYQTSAREADALAGELGNALSLACDAGDPEAMARLGGEVARRLGAPDTLVLNAGGRDLYGAAADGDFSRFRRHMESQLGGAHALVSACLPAMIEAGGGSIIAIGSTYAEGAPPAGMAAYVVAKSALAAYIRCLAQDYGPSGVRANIVSPGMTRTALLSGVPERAQKVEAARNPLRRLAEPEDVVGAIAFLASPEARYVNGHTLVVSGGSVMT